MPAIQTLKLVIFGEPKPKQSARFSIVNNKIHKYQSTKVKNIEQDIRMQVISQLPENFQIITTGIIIIKLWYVFTPVKSLKKSELKAIEAGEYIPKITKPDLTDNLQKGLFDALQGIVFANDSQIYGMDNVKKMYGKTPRIEMELMYG